MKTKTNNSCNWTPSYEKLSKLRGLKIAHHNIHSLTNHIDQLRIGLATKPLHILTLSETWLKPSLSSQLLDNQGYNLARMIDWMDQVIGRYKGNPNNGSFRSCSHKMIARPWSKWKQNTKCYFTLHLGKRTILLFQTIMQWIVISILTITIT